MRRNEGMTLIELLVALAILGIVIGIASSGIVSSLRVQSVQQAATETQARLRRVSEVFTQELRSAVLGAVTNDPYPATSTSISFALLAGGGGYPVLPHDSGNNNSFKVSVNMQVTADSSAEELEGSQVLMVNGVGQGVLLDVTNAVRNGPVSNREYNLVHPACSNTIDYTEGTTLAFAVETIGIRFDPDSGTLFQTLAGGPELPMAFDLEGVEIRYVYEESDGTPHALTGPAVGADGTPLRSATIDVGGTGVPASLARIEIVLDAQEPAAGGRMVERTYAGQVELSENQSFQINEVVPCD